MLSIVLMLFEYIWTTSADTLLVPSWYPPGILLVSSFSLHPSVQLQSAVRNDASLSGWRVKRIICGSARRHTLQPVEKIKKRLSIATLSEESSRNPRNKMNSKRCHTQFSHRSSHRSLVSNPHCCTVFLTVPLCSFSVPHSSLCSSPFERLIRSA